MGLLPACQSAPSVSEALASSPSGNAPAATSAAASGAPAVATVTPVRVVNYRFESQKLGVIPVLVRIPSHAPGVTLPALTVLHGRGEAQKSPERGARGFIDDYGLEAAWAWLESKPGERHAPPEVPLGYRKTVEAELDRAPFKGLVVVMPYLPDRFRGPEAFVNAPDYAAVLRQIVSRVRAELPVRQERQAWALDGISLGGRVAMNCVLELSDVFGAFGSVQAAIDERELTVFADLLAEARKRHPALRFSLATSDQDYFRVVLEHYHRTLESRSLTHGWTMLPGDHSYAFNRGPGVTHLLLSYSRL